MRSKWYQKTRDCLGDGFEERKIVLWQMKSDSQMGYWRVEDELRGSKLLGITWSDIDAAQARGSWDVLEFLEPAPMMILLPGYLQWLWEPEEASEMLSALPHILLRTDRSSLTESQRLGIARLFSAVLAHTADILDNEDIDAYLATIQIYRYGDRRALPPRQAE
jgi:hypothetical protein